MIHIVFYSHPLNLLLNRTPLVAVTLILLVASMSSRDIRVVGVPCRYARPCMIFHVVFVITRPGVHCVQVTAGNFTAISTVFAGCISYQQGSQVDVGGGKIFISDACPLSSQEFSAPAEFLRRCCLLHGPGQFYGDCIQRLLRKSVPWLQVRTLSVPSALCIKQRILSSHSVAARSFQAATPSSSTIYSTTTRLKQTAQRRL